LRSIRERGGEVGTYKELVCAIVFSLGTYGEVEKGGGKGKTEKGGGQPCLYLEKREDARHATGLGWGGGGGAHRGRRGKKKLHGSRGVEKRKDFDAFTRR